MTNEEKQAFFCLYYNQKVAKIMVKFPASYFCKVVTVVLPPFYNIDHLELRTIENLTDSELIKIGVITQTNEDIDHLKQGTIYVRRMKSNTNILESRLVNQQLIDYLRSIGILVAFRQFTPEILIAEGVVKIKI